MSGVTPRYFIYWGRFHRSGVIWCAIDSEYLAIEVINFEDVISDIMTDFNSLILNSDESQSFIG